MDASNFAVVLAAGKGTRMHSPRPKVLHTILGDTMLHLVVHACRPVFQNRILIVIGHEGDQVRMAMPDGRFVEQPQQLGTGHALQCALPALTASNAQWATVINGDAPLLDTGTLESFLGAATGADVAFATITLDNPGAYGRVVRQNGEVSAVVEAKDFQDSRHGAPTGEVNAGLYLFNISAIAPLVHQITNTNASGEYYITDLIALALQSGLVVRGIPCGSDTSLLGVNSPGELAMAEDILAQRQATCLLQRGVILHSPQMLRISPLAHIEPGAEISGPTEISGHSRIASGVRIGSHCVILHSSLDAGAEVRPFCHLEHAHVGPGALVGPYARLRPQAMLAAGAHVGNFVELKNATLGPGAKANHLTYLGDAYVGARSNIGAGTITCNYDGSRKHHTHIGEEAFIGSNTALVAPITVGDHALVGAGSTLTKDVADNELAIARARQKNLPRRKL